MITMQFVFSSEEYPEYVASNFNDAFGVWVNGSFVPVSITVQGNVAIDEVNAGKNKNLYHDKTSDQFNTEMDGFTLCDLAESPGECGAGQHHQDRQRRCQRYGLRFQPADHGRQRSESCSMRNNWSVPMALRAKAFSPASTAWWG